MSLLAKFPPEYIRSQMYGGGTAGLFSGILQVISLALSSGSPTKGALIYFISGTTVIFITALLAYLSKYSEHHAFYMGDTVADTKKGFFTLKEIWCTFKLIWSCVLIFTVSLGMLTIGSPNITSLVISEYYSTGNEWNSKYIIVNFYLFYACFLFIIIRSYIPQ